MEQVRPQRQLLFEEACKLSMRVREDFAILTNPLALYKDPKECVEAFRQRSEDLKKTVDDLVSRVQANLDEELQKFLVKNEEVQNG